MNQVEANLWYGLLEAARDRASSAGGHGRLPIMSARRPTSPWLIALGALVIFVMAFLFLRGR